MKMNENIMDCKALKFNKFYYFNMACSKNEQIDIDFMFFE